MVAGGNGDGRGAERPRSVVAPLCGPSRGCVSLPLELLVRICGPLGLGAAHLLFGGLTRARSPRLFSPALSAGSPRPRALRPLGFRLAPLSLAWRGLRGLPLRGINPLKKPCWGPPCSLPPPRPPPPASPHAPSPRPPSFVSGGRDAASGVSPRTIVGPSAGTPPSAFSAPVLVTSRGTAPSAPPPRR